MGALPEWEADLRYEMQKISSLPHTVVYVEGGYADGNTVNYTAKILNAIGVDKVRGFFTNDNEDLCNPSGRGLGIEDTTDTGSKYADAFMWTHPPGNSSGCGGGPPGGVFWPALAEGEASRANDQLGPGFPSRAY
jgi:cellulase/cellobiase CelA1